MPKKKINLADLRKLNQEGNSLLLEMIEAGKFEDVVAIIKADKDQALTMDDALKPNKLGINLIMLLGWQNKLEDLFVGEIWKKNYQMAQELMTKIPDEFADQIDKNKVSTRLARDTLHQQSTVKLRKRRPNR